MKEKQIVLRAIGHFRGALDVAGAPPAFASPSALMNAPAPAALRVEIEELDRHHLARIAGHSDVLAVAPAIPLQLIAPLESEPAEPAGESVEWGVRAVGAHASPFTGRGITVAVLDTGIDSSHPAFNGVTLVERNFTSEAPGDLHGHGTHCAGTIFGRDIDGQRIGVARGVSRALIAKVLGAGGGGSDALADAINWAYENGAHVISMSLGIDFPGYVESLTANGWPIALATSKALDDYRLNVLLFERVASLLRAQSAFRQPCLVVAAAGNESRRNLNPDFEIHVSPPGVAEGNISVSALERRADGLAPAWFSNTGATLSGPGVDIVSARPGGGLARMSGTSMATPHVAGVAALWAEKLAAAHSFTQNQWSARLIASSVTQGIRAPFDAVDVGAGLVQAPQV